MSLTRAVVLCSALQTRSLSARHDATAEHEERSDNNGHRGGKREAEMCVRVRKEGGEREAHRSETALCRLLNGWIWLLACCCSCACLSSDRGPLSLHARGHQQACHSGTWNRRRVRTLTLQTQGSLNVAADSHCTRLTRLFSNLCSPQLLSSQRSPTVCARIRGWLAAHEQTRLRRTRRLCTVASAGPSSCGLVLALAPTWRSADSRRCSRRPRRCHKLLCSQCCC